MSFLPSTRVCACPCWGGEAAGDTARFYPSSISAPRRRHQQVCGPHLTSTAGAGASAGTRARTRRRVFWGGGAHKNKHKLPPHRGGSEQDAPPRRRDSAPAHLSVRAASRRLRPPPESSVPATGTQRARLCVQLPACTKVVRAFLRVHRSRLPCGRGRDAPIERDDDAPRTHLRLTGEKNNSGQMEESYV